MAYSARWGWEFLVQPHCLKPIPIGQRILKGFSLYLYMSSWTRIGWPMGIWFLTVQWIGTETGELGNKNISKDHRHCSIVEIGQNTSKNPTDLMRLHHHHIVLAARISLTLSRHSSLSFIALGRSSGQQPVSSHSCWMYVRAGRPAFARPCVGIHKSTSLMSSSLLLQQCPACLVRLTWIVFVIGGRWPYSWCLVECCCQDLLRIARSILV